VLEVLWGRDLRAFLLFLSEHGAGLKVPHSLPGRLPHLLFLRTPHPSVGSALRHRGEGRLRTFPGQSSEAVATPRGAVTPRAPHCRPVLVSSPGRGTPCPGQPKPIQPCSPNATLTLEATHVQQYPAGGEFKASPGGLQLARTALLFSPDTSRGHSSPITISAIALGRPASLSRNLGPPQHPPYP